MPDIFDDLNLGDKVNVHLNVFERRLNYLDTLCAMYNVSRAAILEELLKAHENLELKAEFSRVPGRLPSRAPKTPVRDNEGNSD